jgi:hypothetical protein
LRAKETKPRFTRPTKLTTAKMTVRVEECCQTNSLRIRPAVPTMIRTKALILRKSFIRGDYNRTAADVQLLDKPSPSMGEGRVRVKIGISHCQERAVIYHWKECALN